MSNIRSAMKARRRARESAENVENSKPRGSKSRNDSWSTGMEEDSVEMTQMNGHSQSVEMLNEVQEAESLMQDLTTRRKEKQRELSKTLVTPSDDVTGQLRQARKKSKAKITESVRKEQQSNDEDDESIDDIDGGIQEIGGAVEEDAVEEMTIADESPRPRPTPRKRSGGPMSLKDAVDTVSSMPEGKSPRNLNASIRDRLKNKLKHAREKAESEVSESPPGRRLRGLRDKSYTSTRFDDPSFMSKEDYDTETKLEETRRKSEIRSKWKAVAKTTISGTPTEGEAYDFFTRNWDPLPTHDDTAVPDEPQPGPSNREDTGTAPRDDDGGQEVDEASQDDERKKLIEQLESEDLGKPYVVGRAEYMPYQERISLENEVYFVPSILAAPPSEKIPEDAELRYLEEEGLYVGIRPAVATRNKNKMEHRLLHEADKGRKWFGEDGTLIALADPLRETPSRPYIPEEVDPELRTDYKKAITKEFDYRFIDGSVAGGGRYQLDIDINSLTFTHHHLYSREHVLATRITQLYNQYCKQQQQKLANYLTEKLQALKGAAQNLQGHIISSTEKNHNQDIIADLEKRLEDYKYEIKQTRQLRDKERQAERNCLRSIIKTWKNIKNLRKVQGFTNTPVKLQIHKEETNKAEEEERLNNDIDEEVNELCIEYEEDYNKKLMKYNTQIEEWKSLTKSKKEAQRRQKLRRKKKSKATDRAEEEEELLKEEERDQEILEQNLVAKPVKPVKFNDGEIRESVKQRMLQTRRRPGEPILTPILSNTATVTPANLCAARGEEQRRNDVSRCRIFVKILYNNKEVSRTPVKNMGQDFRVTFAQIFNIQIVQWPENVKIEVHESRGLTSTLLSEVYVSIPESTCTTSNMKLEDIEFSSEIIVQHNHEAVGSGVSFSLEADGAGELCMFTTGNLSVAVSWAVDDDGQPLVPPTNRVVNNIFNAVKGLDAVAAIGVAGMVDMERLSKWISESRLDPNDPSNADIMYLMKPQGGGGGSISQYQLPNFFRLEQLQEEFNFTTDEEIENSKRYQLIQYREKEIPEFKSYRMIPANDKEILQDIFIEYEKKKKEEDRIKTDEDPESHRAKVAKFLQRVREQVMLRFRVLQHQKAFPDVIFEDEVPNIGTLGISLIKLGEPRRPLRPVRKERKKVSGQSVQDKDIFILVNIVRAFDVPIRVQETSTQPTAGQALKGQIKNIAGSVLVRPYIEVMFQHERKTSTVADGPNPSWNEELQLLFRPPNNDVNPNNLQTVKDVLYLNLFDQVVTDVLEDNRQRDKSVHQKIEKRWLGSLKIPFSTVYFNTMIEGTFKLEQPSILLGYKHDSKRTEIDNEYGGGIEIGMGAADQTYVSLFITMEPQLSAPEPVREKFDSNEDEKLLQSADAWLVTLQNKFKDREFKTTVIDINGKSVFITRYFKPLSPPGDLMDESLNSKKQAEKIARFVSMIPFVSDSVVFPGLCDIWSTCDQFLHMLAGDEEEHAVLLVNYFLHMKKRAWLLLGTAIPEGSTAYVLTREEEGGYAIWNPNTGEKFSHRDNYCPLQSVGCLVNDENIWANMQPNSQPARISFDLTNTSNWRPFFTRSFPKPDLSSIQPEDLVYTDTDLDEVQLLRDKIEQVLKRKFMENWRPTSVTRWNRYCTQKFKLLLKELEFSQGKALGDQHMAELNEILGSYKLCGFPINLPYTEVQAIVEAVYATGVWENDSNDVEFALAVHIHAYKNSVMSVWVYVASLMRKR